MKKNISINKKIELVMTHVNPKNLGSILAKNATDIKDVEDIATAQLHTAQQFYLLLQTILMNKFGLTEKDLKVLNQEMTKAVEGLAWFEEKGLNPMSVQSIGQLVDITMNHYVQFKAQKAGITLPESKTAKRLLG